MSKPKSPGWHWFLPDEKCPTPTRLIRTDLPVVVLVGQDKYTRDGPPARLVVRFSTGMMYCDDLPGDWVRLEPPRALAKKR